MEDLGTRFAYVNQKTTQWARENRAIKSLEKNFPNFESALDCLKDVEKSTCRLIDSNACVYSTAYCQMRPIEPICFREDMTMDIRKAYYTIRGYLRKYKKINGDPTDESAENQQVDMPFHVYTGRHIDDKTARFLYEITSGDVKVLGAFAKLCARLRTKSLSAKRPIVILADRSIHQTLIDFIWYWGNQLVSFYGLNDLLENEKLIDLYGKGLSGYFANVVIEGKIPQSEMSVRKLKDLLTGKTLSITNPFFSGKLFIKNRLPFIYITDNHNKYLKIKRLYNAYDVKLPGKGEVHFDPNIIPWVNNELVALGQKWELDKRQKPFALTRISSDDIFLAFVQDVCVLKEDAVCPKSELYDAYCKYYTMHYTNTPLSRIIFGKQFALFGNFETVRPHSSRNSYPYCFQGIKISQKKYDKVFGSGEAVKYQSTFEAFKQGINDCIDATLKKAEEPKVHTNG